jgi:16S rRNA (adenine1518-N6/adenine1519-N6)-dimethyltransferase
VSEPVHRARRRFGQHFLHQTAVIDRIVRAVAIKPGDAVVEIGPGLGALTVALLETAANLDVVELDRELAAKLQTRFDPDTVRVHQAHLMLQKEVVERMAASPGGRDYGRLSVMVQFRCQVKVLFSVAPDAFRPPPKVYSTVVRLIPLDAPAFPVSDVRHLERVVSLAFGMRRKILRNSLKSVLSAAEIEATGVDPGARPETLGLAAFAALANRLS